MSDLSELEFVDHVAHLFGISVDDDIWRDAEDSVRQNEAERNAQVDPDPDYDEPQDDNPKAAAERREIEAIFVRLAE